MVGNTTKLVPTIRSDGVLELRFKSRRTSPTVGGLLAIMLLALILVPVSIVSTLALGYGANGQWQSATLVLYLILLVGLWVFLNPTSKIVIKPKEGFHADSRFFKFNEVKRFHYGEEKSENAHKYFMIADTLKGEKRFTNYVSIEVADFIFKELRTAKEVIN